MSRGEGRIHVFESYTHLLTTVGHHLQCFGDVHDPARIGGLVAILCSVTAGEGFVLLPVSVITLSPVTDTDTDGVFQRRSIMLSLPLVFLAYSVAGFIMGVVIYSFRSATINLAHAGMPVAAKFRGG